MTRQTNTVPDEFKFMAGVNAAIVGHQYEEALQLFLKGITDLLMNPTDIDIKLFEYHVSNPLSPLLRFAMTEHPTSHMRAKEDGQEPSCSFCGKYESEVQLVGGPGVFICSGCVALCGRIISEPKSPSDTNSRID